MDNILLEMTVHLFSEDIVIFKIEVGVHEKFNRLYVCLCVRKVYWGKTADWIWMPFGVVSGVGRGIGVLDGGHVPQGEGKVSGGGFAPLVWMAYFNGNVFDSCVESWQYFRTDNNIVDFKRLYIGFSTSEDVVSLKIEVGFTRNFQ